MKILVDRDSCEGHAQCVKAAPEVFRVTDEDYAEVICDDPGPELLEKVKLAVKRCPRAALSIVTNVTAS